MIPPFSFSLRHVLDVVMASSHNSQSIRSGGLESGRGISDQKSVGGCSGVKGWGVTLARHAQVVWLKRDSHLWCGWVEHGLRVCLLPSNTGHVCVNDFYGACTSGELCLVGFEP